MNLSDAYDDILLRKAIEAPGGAAPLLTELEPDAPPASTQITITGKKYVPPVKLPTLDPWDKIIQNRAVMPVPKTDWKKYLPWAAIGILGIAAFLILQREGD